MSEDEEISHIIAILLDKLNLLTIRYGRGRVDVWRHINAAELAIHEIRKALENTAE